MNPCINIHFITDVYCLMCTAGRYMYINIHINILFFLLCPSYYVNGRDTSLEDFLDPDILDSLALKTKAVLEVTTWSGPLPV